MRNVNTEVLIGWPAKEKSYSVTVWVQHFPLNPTVCFPLSFFFLFFFFHAFQGGRRQNFLFMRQMSLFTHYSGTVYALFMGITTTLLKKILKMGPTVLFTHLKIILLQYFQFLVFNFSNNKFNLNRPNR